MKRAYIFGCGGHARVIASIIHDRYTTITFIDQSPPDENVIPEDQFFNRIREFEEGDYFIGIGSNKNRINIFNRLKSFDRHVANCIASNAYISHDALLGEGVTLCPGSVIGAQARIGTNTIVNTLASIDHDCVLGDHSQVTPGVTFGGTTIVGRNCFFGIKSATIQNITVGDNVFITAGSLLIRDVPDNVRVAGVPARVIREVSDPDH